LSPEICRADLKKINKRNLLHLVGCLHRCSNDARSHKHEVFSINVGNKYFEMVEDFEYVGKYPNKSHFILDRITCSLNSECLLSFGAESFVFQFVIKKYRD